MFSMKRLTGLAFLVLGAVIALPSQAQPAPKRTVLNQADLSGAPGIEVISSILEVPPGATVPRHYHNGIEAGRVLEGAMIQYPGKEPQMMETGTALFNDRGVLHAGFKVVGDKALKIYSVYAVDKGKPLLDGIEAAKP